MKARAVLALTFHSFAIRTKHPAASLGGWPDYERMIFVGWNPGRAIPEASA